MTELCQVNSTAPAGIGELAAAFCFACPRQSHQSAWAEQVAAFEERMGDGGQVGLDALQVADGVEQEVASVDLLAPALLLARELAFGGRPLQLAEVLLLLHQAQGG